VAADSGVESPRKAAVSILVVDDSLSIQQSVRDAFAEVDGVEVRTCGDVDAAEILLAQRAPDLVLCDVVLPGRSGYELCAALKARPSTRSVPVFLLSSSFEPFDDERARQVGADAVVGKPFTAAEIREQVRDALSQAPAAGPEEEASQPAPADPAVAADGEGEATVLATAVTGPEESVPEITEADLVGGRAPAAASPTDELARRLVEPLAERLLEPVVAEFARRLAEGGSLKELAREAITEAAERLVRARLRELEETAASRDGEETSSDSA
jgi:CheY-like chemotaxis protein